MTTFSPTWSNSGWTSSFRPPRFWIWNAKTSRASSGPRQDGVRFHHRWPCDTPRHSASGANNDANGSGSPSLSASAAVRSLSSIAVDYRRGNAVPPSCDAPQVTLLADVVRASEAVAGTSSRSAKVATLAELLRSLEPAEVPVVAALLSGVPRQGRIGVGYARVYGREQI